MKDDEMMLFVVMDYFSIDGVKICLCSNEHISGISDEPFFF